VTSEGRSESPFDEADIEAVLRDLGLHHLRVRHQQPWHDGRMERIEFAQDLRQQVFGDGHARADQQRSADMSGHVLEPRIHFGRQAEDAVGIVEHHAPRLGERDLSMAALEKARTPPATRLRIRSP